MPKRGDSFACRVVTTKVAERITARNGFPSHAVCGTIHPDHTQSYRQRLLSKEERNVNIRHRLPVALLIVMSFGSSQAGSGDPVAIRRWKDGIVTLETMWDLNIVVDFGDAANAELKKAADFVVDSTLESQAFVQRSPNTSEVTVTTEAIQSIDPNSIRITPQEITKADNANPPSSGNSQAISIEVDGLKLLFVDTDTLPETGTLETNAFTSPSLVVLTFSKPGVLQRKNLTAFVKTLHPGHVLLNPALGDIVTDAAKLQALLDQDQVADASTFNTFAISDSSKPSNGIQLVTLSETPKQMPEKLAELFRRMEKSCADSQAVFEKLSVEQMNWKPSNGTHTPRWNTEHMMGRQLRFFSQIYNAIDPSIPVIDLNPKQMPKDYVYAHEDWSGAEEARQMDRVSKFTRRFSYLIHDLDVNKRAPGSGWPSLRALLLQMERHYSEHTANTVKKFDLPDWPIEKSNN